jgi:hypothetical protein
MARNPLEAHEALNGPLNPFMADEEVLLEISNILNTGLDKETLSILVELCEAVEVGTSSSDATGSES